jgi:5-methylcytosine-specific restriction endonuclease McrA
MKTFKEKILELRQQGKSYRQIEKELGCSRATICYYCRPGQKDKVLENTRKRRAKQHPFKRKMEYFTRVRYKPYDDTNRLGMRLDQKIYKFQRRNSEVMTFNVKDVISKFGENTKCYLTGKSINIYDTRSYEFDHIIPVSRGGDNSLDNMQICLKAANKAKHNLLIEEFIDLCRSVVNTYDKK